MRVATPERLQAPPVTALHSTAPTPNKPTVLPRRQMITHSLAVTFLGLQAARPITGDDKPRKAADPSWNYPKKLQPKDCPSDQFLIKYRDTPFDPDAPAVDGPPEKNFTVLRLGKGQRLDDSIRAALDDPGEAQGGEGGGGGWLRGPA